MHDSRKLNFWFQKAGIYLSQCLNQTNPVSHQLWLLICQVLNKVIILVFLIVLVSSFNSQSNFFFIVFTFRIKATSQQVADALVGHEKPTPQQSIEIKGSNNIQMVEREDDGIDLTQVE